MMNVGDKVCYLNEVGEGIIVSILPSKKIIVENEHGFEMEYFAKDLVLKSKSKEYKLEGLEHNLAVKDKIRPENQQKKIDTLYTKSRSLNRIETPEEIEVDLHIEELVDSHFGMTNATILQVQMANFRRELNVAIRRKVKRLIIIHGVGEGVLKAEIKNELYVSYPSMEHHDASYRKYGYGATEILIYTNN